jgi:hypothetical protein
VGWAWYDRQVRVLAEVLADDRVCAQADLVGAPRAVHVAEDELDLGPRPQELGLGLDEVQRFRECYRVAVGGEVHVRVGGGAVEEDETCHVAVVVGFAVW